MSKPRYDWWPYVKGMIRRYPQLKAEYDALTLPTMTADYSGMPRSGSAGRNTERYVLRELKGTKQREYAAVKYAIFYTEHMRDGAERMRLVRMIFWERRYTLDGAAYQLHVSIATAKRWHGEFIRLVGGYYGLLDKDDTQEPK